MHRWVLESFGKGSSQFVDRRPLNGLDDDEVMRLLELTDLGYADLFDVPDAALEELGRRYGIAIDGGAYDYLLGREATS